MELISNKFPEAYFDTLLPETIERITPSFSYEHPGIYTFQGAKETGQSLQIFATPFWDADNTIPIDSTDNHGETTIHHGKISTELFTGNLDTDAKKYVDAIQTHLFPLGIKIS